MYAWHRGTPNGPIKPFAVFAICNLNVPRKCQMVPHAELSLPMSCASGTEHINPCRCLPRHTLEDVSYHTKEETLQAEHHGEKCLLRERWWGQRQWNSVSTSLYCKKYSLHQILKTTAGRKPLYFFLSPLICQQVRKSLLNVINLKGKISKE